MKSSFIRPAAVLLLTVVSPVATHAGAQTSARTPSATSSPSSAGTEVSVADDYVIGAEDVLGVQFWREPEMSGDVVVRPDGMITLPLLGEVKAEGLKPNALRDEVKAVAGRFLTEANVTVIVRQVNSRKVYVTGQVAKPGAYSLASPRTVLQALAMAGGLTEYAESDNISIARTEGGKTRLFKFNYKNVSKGKGIEQNIQLQPGDTVMVP
jgi:polysaccharide biosynthesis/export protein